MQISERIFFCVADKIKDQNYGVGHLNRCRMLLNSPYNKAKSSNLVIISENTKIELLNQKECLLNPNIEWAKQLKNAMIEGNCDFIFDCSCKYLIKSPNSLNTFLDTYKKAGIKFHIIDSYGQESIFSAIENKSLVTNLFIPYMIPKKFKPNYEYHGGKEFLLIDQRFNVTKKLPVKKAKILITTGGSDPEEISCKVIQILSKFKDILNIRLVVGPNFSEELVSRINKLVCKSKHSIKIIFSPGSLTDETKKCSIGICTSGLTKYEFGFSGTPVIVIPFDDTQKKLNEGLEEIFLMSDLHKDNNNFLEILESLYYNQTVNLEYSKKLKTFFSQNGVKNFFNIINNA